MLIESTLRVTTVSINQKSVIPQQAEFEGKGEEKGGETQQVSTVYLPYSISPPNIQTRFERGNQSTQLKLDLLSSVPSLAV